MRYGRGAGVGRGLGVSWGLGVGVGLGVIVALGVEVAVGVAVGVAVAVAVAVAVGVGDTHGPLIATLSTRQPACETELSAHILQRNFTGWPTPEAGRFTVTVSNPPEPPLEIPLQLGRVGKHGFANPVLMSVWL